MRELARGVLLGTLLVSLLAARSHAQPSAWNVPGDVAALTEAAGGTPGLETFGHNGYLGIECGYQAVLLGSKIPVAPAPHVPWAKPYAKGPIKLLIITTFGNSPSDVAQLAQLTRELQADVRWVLVADVPFSHPDVPDELYRTQYLPAQARAALREDYDAIVMSFGTNTPGYGIAPAHAYLPDDVYQSILHKVQRGTGLLLTGQNNAGWWVTSTPLAAALPATMTGEHWKLSGADAVIAPTSDSALIERLSFDATTFSARAPLTLYGWSLRAGAQVHARAGERPVVMSREHGRGRVVLLGWDGTLLPQDSWLSRSALEHNTAAVLRALSYAARKEPTVRWKLSASELRAGEVSRLALSTNAPAKLEWTLRDGAFQTLASGSTREHNLTLPPLAAGHYNLDVIARDPQGRSLGWGSQPLEARAAATVRVSTDREHYQSGETAEITAAVSGDEARDASWQLEIHDALDRLVSRQTAAVSGAHQTFRYAIRDPRVAPHTATVTLLRAGVPFLQGSAEFFVPSSSWDDYENILWPQRPGTPLNAALHDAGGMTAVLDPVGSDEGSRHGARFGFRAARLNDGQVFPAQVQTAPDREDPALQAILDRAIAAAQRYGALAWLLQDERGQVGDPGMPNDAGKRRYRDYLQQHYRSVDALNERWGTRHASWDAIEPTLTDTLQRGTANLAPWVDFRLYVSDQMFQLDRRHAQQLRAALGKDTLVGLDAFISTGHVLPYAGIDVGRLAGEGVLDFYVPYDEDLLISSLIKGRKAKYLGWRMSREQYLSLPLRDAFRGYAGSVRFFGPTFWSDFGWLQPAGAWTQQGTEALRSGIGKLLIASERKPAPVAILYSYASQLTAYAASSWSGHGDVQQLWGAALSSRAVLEQALLDAGSSFDYRTDAQVAAGGLRDVKLLVLPLAMSMALPDETLAAIEQFVREGGTVLADLTPALCDEHGALRARAGLDALFGVTRARFTLKHGEREYAAGVTACSPLVPEHEWFLDEWYESSLRPTDGRALGEHALSGTPAFVSKHSGRGQTLLLNSLLVPLLPPPNTSVDDNHVALLRRVLAAAGVEPVARVESRSGTAQRHIELNRFVDGRNEYLGAYAQRDPQDPADVQLRFKDTRPTYDVRAGRYLGRVDRVPLPLRAAEAGLFARVDTELHSLRVHATAARRGEPVDVLIAIGASGPLGRHVVRVEVRAPGDATGKLYDRNVIVSQGAGRLQLVPALDEPAGTWRITAREIVSGLSAETTVELD